MRLTNNMIMKRYLRNLNTSYKTLSKLSDMSSSQKLYSRASENPAAAMKAFNVRNDLTRIDFFKNNIVDVKNIYTDYEASISTVNDIVKEINSMLEQAKNVTYTDTELAAIATVLENYQTQLLDVVNRKSADRFLFGGANLTDLPFEVKDGKLYYHGVDVDTGTFEKENIYIDFGMGMSSRSGVAVNDNTAFNIAYSGVDLLGSGVDADGISNNIYNIITDLVQMLKNNDTTNLEKYQKKFESKMSDVLIQYADIGQKTNFIDFIENRLSIDEENFLNKQDSLEVADLAEAFMNLEYQRLAYNAALKIGANLMEGSLLDFLS